MLAGLWLAEGTAKTWFCYLSYASKPVLTVFKPVLTVFKPVLTVFKPVLTVFKPVLTVLYRMLRFVTSVVLNNDAVCRWSLGSTKDACMAAATLARYARFVLCV